MPELSKETAALLNFLLPGLLAAAGILRIYVTCKAVPVRKRIIQAPIFIALGASHSSYFSVAVVSLLVTKFALCPWESSSETLSSAFIALLLGASGNLHELLTCFEASWIREGLYNESPHPSEWHGVLSERQTMSFFTSRTRGVFCAIQWFTFRTREGTSLLSSPRGCLRPENTIF